VSRSSSASAPRCSARSWDGILGLLPGYAGGKTDLIAQRLLDIPLVLFPGLPISLTVFGSKRFGDALRDTLDAPLHGA